MAFIIVRWQAAITGIHCWQVLLLDFKFVVYVTADFRSDSSAGISAGG